MTRYRGTWLPSSCAALLGVGYAGAVTGCSGGLGAAHMCQQEEGPCSPDGLSFGGESVAEGRWLFGEGRPGPSAAACARGLGRRVRGDHTSCLHAWRMHGPSLQDTDLEWVGAHLLEERTVEQGLILARWLKSAPLRSESACSRLHAHYLRAHRRGRSLLVCSFLQQGETETRGSPRSSRLWGLGFPEQWAPP